MARIRSLRLPLICLVIAWALAVCLPSVVHTEHEYILLRTEEGKLVSAPDDDPLYEQFDREVLGDPYLRHLLMVFEHTTEAFLATNTRARYPQTVANRPMIVLDSAGPGVLRDMRADFEGTPMCIELALGLGHEGAIDMVAARDNMAPTIASLTLKLMGVESQATPEMAWPAADEIVAPGLAFERGLQIAFEAMRAARDPNLLRAAKQAGGSAAGDRWTWYELVPNNGYRYRFAEDQPTAALRSPDEALCTPGVAAAFFYRLMQHSDEYYPQRFMLWFVNYDADEIAEAKIVLTWRYLSGGDASMHAFIKSYVETFPADKERVLALANETFGTSDWLAP